MTERAHLRRSQAIDAEQAALLRVVCSILDAQLDVLRAVAMLSAERGRAASNAAARAEQLRTVARGAG